MRTATHLPESQGELAGAPQLADLSAYVDAALKEPPAPRASFVATVRQHVPSFRVPWPARGAPTASNEVSVQPAAAGDMRSDAIRSVQVPVQPQRRALPIPDLVEIGGFVSVVIGVGLVSIEAALVLFGLGAICWANFSGRPGGE